MIKKVLFICLVIIFLNGCVPESDLKNEFVSFVPLDIGDGWILSDPVTENINADALTRIYRDVHNDDNLWQIRSLLVFRHGRLVAESYMKDEDDRTSQRAIWSCTKQVMGILMGIAMEKGMIISIDDTIENYLPEKVRDHPDKKDITLRNLMKMQSGINFDNDEHTDVFRREQTNDSIEFILSLPMNHEQGTYFQYNDGNPHILSAILQKVTGKYTDEWADEMLFSKMQLTNYHWHRYKDGITLGAFGILMPPRELAKIAQSVLDEGFWKETYIINAQWIHEMTGKKVDLEDYDFGYLWWMDESRNIVFMQGHGGQYAFISREKELLVVMTAEPNTQGEFQLSVDKALKIVDKITAISY